MISRLYRQAFPILDIDDDYYLREQTLEDTPAFFEYYSDPIVGEHILASNPRTLTEASQELLYCRNLFYRKQGIFWSLCKKSDNTMVGCIGLYLNNHHHRAELSYDLSRQFWRQGIMSRAINTVLQFAFHTAEIERMEAVTALKNLPSQSLLKKTGFIHEGMMRKYRFYDNRMHDVEMFGMTKEVLDAFQAQQKQAGELAAA